MAHHNKNFRRGSSFEVMESRQLMAADVQIDPTISANPNAGPVYLQATDANRASDVNQDGVINHRDAHSVVSFLNSRTAQDQGVEGEANEQMDVNGDGEVSPLDLMWIVNQVNEYDPLTPCDCGACSRPSVEGRCENASLAQTQSASILANTVAPAGEFIGPTLESLLAAQALEEQLRNMRS